MLTGDTKIALIHDELTRRGGAEIVFEELASLFPKADVFSLYAGQPVFKVGDTLKAVQTSYLQKFPAWFRRHPGRMLPFLSHAAEQFDLSNYDLVISSSSGFAKAIITRSTVPHVSYCHTPTRYLWDTAHEVSKQRPFWSRWVLRITQHYLRLVDFTAAQRVDLFLANSLFTQQRIHRYYRRYSEIVHPPIDTDFFTPATSPKKDYFLLVGRLTPTKHFDTAIRVCEKLHLPLVVVGKGPEKQNLQRFAKQYTRFVGHVSKEQLRDYYRSARALLQPGIEDFGMSSAESLACGTPVIGFKQGGIPEIIDHTETGLLYSQPGEEALAEALRLFLSHSHVFSPQYLHERSLRFSKQRFTENIYNQVSKVLH